jgi:hypothetical protein
VQNIIGDKIRKLFSRGKIRRYTIGGKAYVQKPLVLGQFRQLLDLLKGTSIPANAGVVGVIVALGDKVPVALAIVLVEDGKSSDEEEKYLKERDIEALAAGVEFAITPGMVLEVIDDFLACNPLSSHLEKVAGMMGWIARMMPAMTTGSPNSASSSPTETLLNAIGSPGA